MECTVHGPGADWFAPLMRFLFLSVLLRRWGHSTRQWTLLHGSDSGTDPIVRGSRLVPEVLNQPASYYGCAATATSSQGGDGRFWAYFGKTASAAFVGQLWSFDPTTSMWVWTAGSSLNNSSPSYSPATSSGDQAGPGNRIGQSCWWSHGKFWVRGGYSHVNTAADVFRNGKR
jgi:hypothetical protein